MDNAINSMALTMIGDQPFDLVCDILRKTYQRDIELLSKIDASSFRPGNYVYDRTRAATGHCYEHAQSLEQLNEPNEEPSPMTGRDQLLQIFRNSSREMSRLSVQ